MAQCKEYGTTEKHRWQYNTALCKSVPSWMFLGFRPRDLNNEVCFIVNKVPTVCNFTFVRGVYPQLDTYRSWPSCAGFVWVRSILKGANLGPQYLFFCILTSVRKFSWKFLLFLRRIHYERCKLVFLRRVSNPVCSRLGNYVLRVSHLNFGPRITKKLKIMLSRNNTIKNSFAKNKSDFLETYLEILHVFLVPKCSK